MPDDLHRRRGIHPCPSEIGRGTMPKVVEPEVRDAGILQRGPKGSADTLKRSALVGEDVVIGQTANLVNRWKVTRTSGVMGICRPTFALVS